MLCCDLSRTVSTQDSEFVPSSLVLLEAALETGLKSGSCPVTFSSMVRCTLHMHTVLVCCAVGAYMYMRKGLGIFLENCENRLPNI